MQPRYAKVFPETLVSLQFPFIMSPILAHWHRRKLSDIRNASTIAQQWLHLNDYCRGNPDHRPVGSAAQTDDRFVAMSSKVCDFEMSSKRGIDPNKSKVIAQMVDFCHATKALWASPSLQTLDSLCKV